MYDQVKENGVEDYLVYKGDEKKKEDKKKEKEEEKT